MGLAMAVSACGVGWAGDGASPATALKPGDDVVVVSRIEPDGMGFSLNVSGNKNAMPLSAFAMATAVDPQLRSLQGRVAAVESRSRSLETQIAELRRTLAEELRRARALEARQARGVALLGAVDFQRPLEGCRVRLAVGGGTYEGETAVGLNLTTVRGRCDLGIGVATTEGETLGKAAVGVSW
jgi:TolA-binding protein